MGEREILDGFFFFRYKVRKVACVTDKKVLKTLSSFSFDVIFYLLLSLRHSILGNKCVYFLNRVPLDVE